MQPNRRKMRAQLGSRTTRRSGTKSSMRNPRVKTRMKDMLVAFSRGEIDANGRDL